MFASDKIIFIKAIMLSRRSELWKPGRQFFPEIDKLFVQCSRKCIKSNFPKKVFVWKNSSGLVKGTLDNAAVHFCHYLETFFSSKSEIFYGNIFLEKKLSSRIFSGKYDAFLTTCWNFLSILKHFHLNSKKMLENISFWRWCWRVSFRSPQNTRSNPKKNKIFLKKIFSENFLWTHKLYFNRPWRKKFGKGPNFFLSCPKKFIENYFFQKSKGFEMIVSTRKTDICHPCW